MRQFAKMTLLLAPLMIASASGCATSSYLTGSKTPESPATRIDRLVASAAQYERNGRPEAAMSIYEYVLTQQPENKYAQQRQELLAKRGIESNSRGLKKNLRNQIAPETADILMASRRKAEDKAPEATPAQIAAKAAQTESRVAAAKPAAETAPVDIDIISKPAQVEKPATLASVDEDWVKAPATTPEAKPATLASSPRIADDDWATVISAASTKAESKAELAAVSSEQENDFKTVSATVAEKPVVETPVVEKKAEWGVTDITRDQVLAVAAKPLPLDESWANTRLVALCDGLPEELVPLVERLESSVAIDRVLALQELGEHGQSARAATVAVHALLEDREPIVAVYAASTLRDIADDAWSSVQTLSKHLKNEDEQIIRLSAYLLGRMGPEAVEAVKELEALRDAGTSLTNLHAAEALTHIAPEDRQSFTKLNDALKSEDGTLRWFAAVSLGSVEGTCEEDAAKALALALKDSEPQVRAAACLSLGGLGDHAHPAIAELENVAKSDAPEVQAAAETALACLRG
ncbi:HEAT repeat domain-containing protein [Planctomicrobium sp. SH527]|uniref:HEAT repeat domain-containing protein n=1 Tax=Planctomicrobium sp. SH527 TaxID=3448123 RepID=UPI003F5BA310